MSGKKSQRKGKSGEREVARLLADELGPLEITRTSLLQAGDGDTSDIWVAGFDIEIKRYSRATEALIADWWSQARARCREGQTPVLAYRGNHMEWRFVVPHPEWKRNRWMLDLHQCQVLYTEGFCYRVRESLPVAEQFRLAK